MHHTRCRLALSVTHLTPITHICIRRTLTPVQLVGCRIRGWDRGSGRVDSSDQSLASKAWSPGLRFLVIPAVAAVLPGYLLVCVVSQTLLAISNRSFSSAPTRIYATILVRTLLRPWILSSGVWVGDGDAGAAQGAKWHLLRQVVRRHSRILVPGGVERSRKITTLDRSIPPPSQSRSTSPCPRSSCGHQFPVFFCDCHIPHD